MGVEWLAVDRADLEEVLREVSGRFPGLRVSVVHAQALIPGSGAFVPVQDRVAAEKIFLADVLVLVADRVLESYELMLSDIAGQAVFITAESKTADIEKKLISGVHGPGECIFVHLQ